MIGTTSHITNYDDPAVTHTYTASGIYTLKITGNIKGFKFGNMSDKLKITNISNWEGLNFGNSGYYFYECSNLTITTSDQPDLRWTTRMDSAFFGCTSITTVPSMQNWDTSGITDMSQMFIKASSFNQDISSWNVSNVTNMKSMFYEASSFNQNIGSWNVGNVTNMDSMFFTASNFNQNISGWNVNNVTVWTDIFVGCPIIKKNKPPKFS